jgi:arylsulfatase A-like enzyme
MDKTVADESQIFQQPKIQYWNVPLMRNDEIIERPADQNTITKRYSLAATNFIRKNKNRPFFLYLAHNMPHVPLFASPDFKNKNARGLYGDVVEEIDWGVGLILETLRREHLARNTFVVFTSDNGPWLSFGELAGSAGILREGKGSTFEGGMRVPCIMWWPGKIKPGIVRDIGCTMDLFTTILTLASTDIPQDRAIDGLNLSPALFGKGPSPRNVMFFYRGTRLYAARKGPYKAHFFTKSAFGKDESVRHDTPLIYHLGQDPGEQYDLADRYPEIIADIQKEVIGHLRTLVVGEDQLTKRIRKR